MTLSKFQNVKKNTNPTDIIEKCTNCKNLQDNAYKAWNMMTSYGQKLLKIQELQNVNLFLSNSLIHKNIKGI